MFPDEPEPAVVDATFDRTPKRKRDCAAATFAPDTPLKSLAHDLNAGGWVDKLWWTEILSDSDSRNKTKNHGGAPMPIDRLYEDDFDSMEDDESEDEESVPETTK